MEEDYLSLSGILKSGGITASDVALDGDLTPKQGRAFANAIVDHSAYLKTITVDITGKLTKTRTALDAAKGVLTRHSAGIGSTDAQKKKLGVVGCKLNMTNGVKLVAQVTDEALEDNQDNPSFEKEQFAGFSTVFGNDLIYLGVVGIADNDDATAPFNELAKGWLTIASESATVVKAEYENSGTAAEKVLAALSLVTNKTHTDVKHKVAIHLSPEDYATYVDYIADEHQNTAVLLSGEAAKYKGRELVIMDDYPQGTYLATPLKNVILGMSRQIKRVRWVDNDTSSIMYKFVARPDYEFDIHKYVVLVTQAA